MTLINTEMKLTKLKLYNYDDVNRIVMYQRFELYVLGIFSHPFSLVLKHNDQVDDCLENNVLGAHLGNRDWLQLGQKAFSDEFRRSGIALSSFSRWIPNAITRFRLVTRNSHARLEIDADPSSIQYPVASQILSSLDFENLLTISFHDIMIIQ